MELQSGQNVLQEKGSLFRNIVLWHKMQNITCKMWKCYAQNLAQCRLKHEMGKCILLI